MFCQIADYYTKATTDFNVASILLDIVHCYSVAW